MPRFTPHCFELELSTHSLNLIAHGSRYIAEEQISHHGKRTPRDHYPPLLCDVTAHVLHSNGPSTHHSKHMSRDIHGTVADVTAPTPADGHTVNTASSIVAQCTVFTELLPGNALIKCVTL
jgi:hypothetical protein